MASLASKLTTIVADAFAQAGYDRKYGATSTSDRPDLAQFQCNGALASAREYQVAPRQIAENVAGRLREHDAFRDVSLAGPGFLNLALTDAYLAAHVQALVADENLGVESVDAPQSVIVDYGGANVAKPMHVGHLRAAIIGESVKRIARAVGHTVLGDVHLGDWGLQMGMLITEVQRRAPDLPYFDEAFTGVYPSESPVTLGDLEEMYPLASSRAQEDPDAMEEARRATFALQQGRPGYLALWRHFADVSKTELKRDYDDLGVTFDLWLGESDTRDRVGPLVQRLRVDGYAEESRGAVVVHVALPDDQKDVPPLMLVKSDGAVLYGTTDLATIQQRVEDYHAELMIYVVDNRQGDHFLQVFRAARICGIVGPGVELDHAGFGTMNGPDGKPFKTRAGGVMRLRDLLTLVQEKATERMIEADVAKDYTGAERQEITRLVGLATLKYADLANQRTKDYVFDLDRFSSFEGRTGPYLLYTNVRTRSILRKAADRGLAASTLLPPSSDAEREVMLKLAELPDMVRIAFEGRTPNVLCDYGYSLATKFNRFYHEHHILSEPDAALRGSWLTLSECFVRTLARTLELLGIEIPDRM